MAEQYRVASLSEIEEGGLLRVRAGDHWVCLGRVDGQVHAIGDECSHAVASLAQGTLKGHVVECPRHGAHFDVRTGRNLSFPAVRPVKHYEVTIDGDDVYVSI